MTILGGVNRNNILIAAILLVVVALAAAGAYYGKTYLSRNSGYARNEASESPRIKTEFTVFEKIRPVEHEDNLGHRFVIADEQHSVRHTLNLYFVESPPLELDETTELTLARLASYFGDAPLDKLTEIGKTAQAFTQKQLTRSFRIATLYEPSKQRPGIYGFVLLRKDDGSEEYLCEKLVSEGLAAIRPEGSYLPYGEPQDKYRQHLVRLEKKAKAEKKGVWAFSRHPADGGFKEEPAAK